MFFNQMPYVSMILTESCLIFCLILSFSLCPNFLWVDLGIWEKKWESKQKTRKGGTYSAIHILLHTLVPFLFNIFFFNLLNLPRKRTTSKRYFRDTLAVFLFLTINSNVDNLLLVSQIFKYWIQLFSFHKITLKAQGSLKFHWKVRLWNRELSSCYSYLIICHKSKNI